MSAHLRSAAAKKLCCCTLLLLHKKQQWRTCTKTAAAALHWRDRITRALRGDRAAGGGHYKARVLRSSARNSGCAGFCTNFEREKALHVLEYRHGSSSCIAMCCTFCRLFDAHAASTTRKLPEHRASLFLALRPSPCSCQGLFLSSHQHFKVFSLGISLPHTFRRFDALKTAPDREKCALSYITWQISQIYLLEATKVNTI